MKKLKFTWISISLMFILLLLMNGCASYNAARPPVLNYDLEAQVNKVELNGVVLMAKPMHLQSELSRYFDNDLMKNGILPIQINIHNKSYDGTLVFSPDGLNLIDLSNNRCPCLSIDQVVNKTKKSYWRTAGWGVLAGVVGIIPSVINISKTNKKIRASYETRMLKGGNLISGSVTEGFTFFAVPPNISSLTGWKLSALLKDPTKGTDVAISYGLSGTVIPRPIEPEQPSEKESEEGFKPEP